MFESNFVPIVSNLNFFRTFLTFSYFVVLVFCLLRHCSSLRNSRRWCYGQYKLWILHYFSLLWLYIYVLCILYCNGLMESAGDSNLRSGGQEWSDRPQVRNGRMVRAQVWNGQPSYTWPMTGDPRKKRLIHYASGRDRERTNPEVK